MRKGKGKGKKPSKSKPGKAKPEKPTGSGEEPSKPGKGGKPEMCCCDEGEGPGGPGGPGGIPEPRGFCVDDLRMAAICVSGTSISDKMGAASTDCADSCGEMSMRSLG